MMKTIKRIVKLEGVADRYTDGIDDNGLVFLFGRVNADNSFAVYKVPSCLKGFRVHNVLLKYF